MQHVWVRLVEQTVLWGCEQTIDWAQNRLDMVAALQHAAMWASH